MAYNLEPIRVRPKFSSQSKREVKRNTALRQARTCYGHLAGVVGMALIQEILRLQWIKETTTPASGNRVAYALTPKGLLAMEELGVLVPTASRSTADLAFGCLDWTEPGHHLGGVLGRAITTFLTGQGFVVRTPGNREVTLKGSPNTWLNLRVSGD